MNDEKPLKEEPVGDLQAKGDAEGSTRIGFGQLSQNRSAILSAVAILLIVDLLDIIFTLLWGEGLETRLLPTSSQLFISAVIDVFLAINLLRGKTWARAWMLVRLVLGIVVWGGIFAIQRDFGSVLMNTGVLLSLIVLLTGTSNRFRTAGGIALATFAITGGLFLSVMMPSINLPTVPETSTIPESYVTYTNEGFFSISYPSDWSPVMSAVAEAEKEVKQYLKNAGMESEANQLQLVFLGGKLTEDASKPLFVSVSVEPRKAWPLETLVENTNSWNMKNMGQYVEHSRFGTTIGGRKAIIQTSQFLDADSILTGFMIACVSGDKFIWVVTCGGDARDLGSNLDTFTQIVRSLRVEY